MAILTPSRQDRDICSLVLQSSLRNVSYNPKLLLLYIFLFVEYACQLFWCELYVQDGSRCYHCCCTVVSQITTNVPYRLLNVNTQFRMQHSRLKTIWDALIQSVQILSVQKLMFLFQRVKPRNEKIIKIENKFQKPL